MLRNYFVFITITFIAVISSCRKPVENIIPTPESIDTSSYLNLHFTGIPPQQTGLYAIVSVANQNGDSVLTNRKIAISQINQQFVSEKIKLEKSNYKISKLIVVKASDTALYATPQAQSAKATLVQTALPLPVAVTTKGVVPASVAVLPVVSSESPTIFGYTTGDFGFEAYLTLRAHLQITVGSVLYDSLPGLLQLEAVKANGDRWLREVNLRQGITSLQVPQDYASYTFTINK